MCPVRGEPARESLWHAGSQELVWLRQYGTQGISPGKATLETTGRWPPFADQCQEPLPCHLGPARVLLLQVE